MNLEIMSLSLSAAKLCKRSAPDRLHHLDYRESFRPDTISHYSSYKYPDVSFLTRPASGTVRKTWQRVI